MIKPSKYMIVFTILTATLGTIVLVVSQRYLPVLLQHTVYYCQSLLESISLQIPSISGTVLLGLLLILVSFALFKFFTIYTRVISLRRSLKEGLQEDTSFNKISRKLGLLGNTFLVKDEQPYAFCHGIRHPKIYISTSLFSMVNSDELEAILLHERHHLEHKDSLIMLLAELTKSLFPFFPVLSDLIRNYKIERELAADHEAVKRMGSSRPIISVLKKLLVIEPSKQYPFAPALADHETIEVRIKALTNRQVFPVKFSTLNILISVLFIGVLTLLAFTPVHAIEVHQQDDDLMMVCLQDDACAAWCKENKSVTPYSKVQNASHSTAPMTPAMSTMR